MIPQSVKLNREDGSLSLRYGDGSQFTLSAEYLRVHSPSAEVRGHGEGQAVLQYGKRSCRITGIEKSGNYALQFTFSDGHDSGIYTWNYLRELATTRDKKWEAYLKALHQAGKSREADTSVVRFQP